MSRVQQASLFASGDAEIDPDATPVRVWLDASSWVDHWPHFLRGADALFEELADRLPWEQGRRRMYERTVDVPRLTCSLDVESEGSPPVVLRTHRLLCERYRVGLRGAFAAYYRDGRDSVAWHADRVDLGLAEHTNAIVSLGGPRRFLLRPKGGGRSRAYGLGSGDLLVLGGAVQHGWEHCVPKVAHAFARIALLFFDAGRQPPAHAQPSPVSSTRRASHASRISR